MSCLIQHHQVKAFQSGVSKINMVNYLVIFFNKKLNYKVFFEVMRDFRLGGINPQNFYELTEFLDSINDSQSFNIEKLLEFNLKDISPKDSNKITKECLRRAIHYNKKCWHPKACPLSCTLDKSGRVKISGAHSIQNNGILSKISEKGEVATYGFEQGKFCVEKSLKKVASIFYGFCNKHDTIFQPIENFSYTKTLQQNFLFSYRGFVIASHKKIEGSYIMNFGNQFINDIDENRKIFEKALLENKFDIIETVILELPAFYPIAASSSFYLDYDFDGNSILHSDNRMEKVYVTFLPSINKSFFLLSYFKKDKKLYGELGKQLLRRNNYKSDITMLLGGHVENIYFNPTYYSTFIKKSEENLHRLTTQTQYDYLIENNDGKKVHKLSITPSNYLNNNFEINFFGY